MHTLVKSILVSAATVASFAVTAQPNVMRGVDASEIDARIARQEQRIERGVQRGQLSQREARALWREHRQIQREDQRAKADGVINRWEARRLVAMLDRADVNIRQARRGDDSYQG